MRCQKCNAEWTLGNSQEKRRITVCPFCGAKLFIKDTIESLVWSLVLEYGKELYQQENELRFTGLLSDFAGDFPKAVKTLKIAIAEHIPAALLACDGKNNEEKLLSMRHCKDKLTEDVGLSEDRATKALNALAHGLDRELRVASEAKETPTVDEKKECNGNSVLNPVADYKNDSYFSIVEKDFKKFAVVQGGNSCNYYCPNCHTQVNFASDSCNKCGISFYAWGKNGTEFASVESSISNNNSPANGVAQYQDDEPKWLNVFCVIFLIVLIFILIIGTDLGFDKEF